MEDLVIEIGTEELPAPVIIPALDYLKEKLSELLKRENIQSYATPRRLAFYVPNFENVSVSRKEKIWGPPAKVAYDEKGNPTQALLGFLKKNKARPEEVRIARKDKGEYVLLEREVEEGRLLDRLSEEFEELLLSVPLPKRMRWSSSKRLTFSRPIRWILALHGSEVIKLSFGKLKADRRTRGHRILSPGELTLKEAKDYLKVLSQAYVIPSYEERKRRILELVESLSRQAGGQPAYPEGLIEEVTNLVEYPFGILGSFEEKYLELPERVIITVCAHHQRFFCIKREDKLLNSFIGISNNRPSDGRILKGYQKVIRARLEDALFFYREDLKTPLEELIPKLSEVLIHPKIGTLLDKTEKLKELARILCSKQNCTRDLENKLLRAVELSKVDVLTHMVNELDELQGYMGYIYALVQGEDPEVARAIEEQYKPKTQEDELPKTEVGAMLSLLDKSYDLIAFFKAGEIPKGSSDPYGLRRSAFGLFRVLEDRDWDLDLRDFFPVFGDMENTRALEDFLAQRLESYLVRFGYDVVRSVIAVYSPLRPKKVITLTKLLSSLKKEHKFLSIVESYRRIVKILPKEWRGAKVREELLKTEEERELYRLLLEYENKDLRTPLELYPFKEAVDNLFERVMIMDKDIQIRENRLSLLFRLRGLYERFGDLSKLVIEEA
jgi:glycyl-tRNA synthetase beta chain